ncbi:putative adenine deaminase [Weizmannia acidilactici]|uniref:adenine deaminase n=1 Tax=Weizmannia acidilactici TaxID=2607726 RepID=A0A5J4J702_9BACI|nr:adenine deaminase C-terminal domain-containing protein [Weizmannia acidilactici]GER68011.1 putative adenine deaminase [Weizmannia acidilactici]GER70702.1 putative adenine deaminase [Weizmannia acidilactici]GER74195.1 putative adenine deaminase [Weizmannia acidilactici]
MLDQRYRWKNKQIREHVAVLDGNLAPTMVLKNARFLHSTLRKWISGHIWIYQDRIVYTGDKLPENLAGCEVVDCSGQWLVPGYVEPHVHPFQLYNPQSFALYAAQTGTTTLINDNLMLVLLSDKKKAFSLVQRFRHFPVTMYWWARFDGQTELANEEMIFSHESVKSWLEHDAVLQGGELTGWPKLADGDDLILHWIQEAKRMRKKIEGHFPGASEKTLAKMMLFGADCDHEAMTGKEVLNRLMQGYTISLRYSSIRPDLPALLDEIKTLGIDQYDQMFFTSDGSSPAFYEQGVLDRMIKIAMKHGVPPVDAYLMASYNVARYYNIQHLHGMIATGRVASINFLESETNPVPVSVLSKGIWMKKDGKAVEQEEPIDWESFGHGPLQLEWDLEYDDLQFSMPFGIEMSNSVITKPYSITYDVSYDVLPDDYEDNFLMLMDKKGKWRINTLIKGFAKGLMGLASSYSSTGDILCIGKSKSDMMLAFKRMKELGGGIVIAEKGEIVHEIPLPVGGIMSDQNMEDLIGQMKKFAEVLKKRGYHYDDPMYSLLFLCATHLPYIRITSKGMYDVMKKTILFPTIMR